MRRVLSFAYYRSLGAVTIGIGIKQWPLPTSTCRIRGASTNESGKILFTVLLLQRVSLTTGNSEVPVMDVGEVRVADDRDFERLKSLADKHDGWKVEYKKKDTTVWTKTTPQSEFKMIKLHTVYKDVSPALLFDVLMDPLYRKKWDVYMLNSYDIGTLNPNNDVGYYAVRSPPPFRNRDFVLQRSWLQTEKESLIINHSVFHESAPPQKGFVRAVSYLTGLVILPDGSSGSKLTYVTQCDPKGSLPACFVNKLTQIFAPNMAKKLRKACLEYTEWKKAHQPGYKPWLHPEQISLPKLDVSRCVSTGQQEAPDDILDESLVEEQEISKFEDLDNV